MGSKTILLSIICYATISLAGCQTLKNGNSLAHHSGTPVEKMPWKKSGEGFVAPVNDVLAANESRVVFFRDANDNYQSDTINIGIGRDNIFQVSLRNGHFSENAVCTGSEIVNVGTMHKESGRMVSVSKSYQFTPQTTTYLQVAFLTTGIPVIQQIPADEALVLLNQSTRQTHQISRFSSDCAPLTAIPIKKPIAPSMADNPIEVKNSPQFSVKFDFDSAGVSTNQSAVLDGMANFIQSYPKVPITLEGHTDNIGSETYNLKLSQSRANSIKNILVDQYGIETRRLRTVGYGEAMPIDTNNTEQGRQNNRRVVAVVNKENN